MNSPHQDDPALNPRAGAAQPPLSLSQLLALARTRTIDEQREALERVQTGAAPVVTPEGDPYLLFSCAEIACAGPLTDFREVLPTLPTTVAIPFSPSWLLGFFALHTELIGLVDPAPFLFDVPEMSSISRSRAHDGRVIKPGATATAGMAWRHETPESGPTALVIGSGERMLALAVSNVSDIAYVRPPDIRSEPGDVAPARTVVSPFQRGYFSLDGSQTTFSVLNLDALLDVVMEALMGVEGLTHE